MTRQEIGAQGENTALAYLQARGMALLARHYCIRGAEIDLILRDGAYIVFVEVKSRTKPGFGTPREAVTPAKQRRIVHAATRWLMEQGLSESFVRFDVVEVTPQGVCHLPNAFDAETL